MIGLVVSVFHVPRVRDVEVGVYFEEESDTWVADSLFFCVIFCLSTLFCLAGRSCVGFPLQLYIV